MTDTSAARLAEAIRREPTEMIAKWRVLDLIADAASLDLRDDVIDTLRGSLAELQALCDDRGSRLDEIYAQQQAAPLPQQEGE